MDKEEYHKRREHKHLAPQPNTVIGLDMGVKTRPSHCSDGTKYDVMVEESDRLKKEQRKLARKKKGSNNHHRNRARIRRAYQRKQNILDDAANKTTAEILKNQTIFIQDEQVKQWHRRYGRKVQHSILGRVKNRLVRHPEQVVVISKWEPTTKFCPICHRKTPEPRSASASTNALLRIHGTHATPKPRNRWSG